MAMVGRRGVLAVLVLVAVFGVSDRPAAQPRPASLPQIEFNYPLPDAKGPQESTPVIAIVADERGVTGLLFTVNGIPVSPVITPPLPARKIAVTVPDVPLRVGENVFAIGATNAAGSSAQVIRIVTRVAAGVATPSPPPLPRVGERYAVVIGSGTYDDPQIPRPRFVENDARAVYEFLTTKGGFKPENVLLVSDTAPMKPTLMNVKRALGIWLAQRAGKDDTVFVYYAGQGAPEVEPGGADRDGVAKYLITRDTDPQALYVSAYPMDELENVFRRIASERVVMFFDTSFAGTAGGAGGRTFQRQSTRSAHLTREFLERVARSKGRVVISGAGPNELALELPELKHGLFTYFLLKGMDGAADSDGDGIVTVDELYGYVQRNVSVRARQENGKQSAVISGSLATGFPLVQVRR